jgi:hypothetical protein
MNIELGKKYPIIYLTAQIPCRFGENRGMNEGWA